MSLTFSLWPVNPMRLAGPSAPTVEGRPRPRTRSLVLHKAAVAPRAGSRHRFSTGAVDRQRDVIHQSGWRLDNYKKNPLLLYAHNYQSVPIGRVDGIRVEGDALVGALDFAPTPFANEIRALVEGGYLNTFSVGFRPLKQAYNAERDGIDFLEQELLEISIVPVPANPNALVEGRASTPPVSSWAKDLTLEVRDWPDDGLVLELADDPPAARPLPYGRWL